MINPDKTIQHILAANAFKDACNWEKTDDRFRGGMHHVENSDQYHFLFNIF